MNYISIQSSRDVIEHFGIKGMKWGNRRSKRSFLPRLQPTLTYDAHTGKPIKGQPRYNEAKQLINKIKDKKHTNDKRGMSAKDAKKYDALSKEIWDAYSKERTKDFNRAWAKREKLVEKKNNS